MPKSTEAVLVTKALLIVGHWLRKLPATLYVPSNFPVKAGLSVNGEAKNWEKLGSCAFDALTNVTQTISVKIIFFISAGRI
jgi:hypothetical protein